MREQALVTKLSQIHKAKSFILAEQYDLLRTFGACLLSAVDRAVTAIQSAGDVQLLVAKSDITTTLMAMESQPPVLDPQGNSALQFSVDSKRLLDVLSEAGNVTDDYTCANSTSTFGAGIETASPGQDASFIITARDCQGTERAVGGDLFEVELQGEKGEKVEVKLVDRTDGTYSATYTLPVDFKDELQLSILFRGVHIQGSPYRVHTTALHFIGFVQWYQYNQPYHEQWRLMDEACAALPGAPPGSRAATWQEYEEGKIEGLPKHASGDVLFTGPGSEGPFSVFNVMKAVTHGMPLNGSFTYSNYWQGCRQAICVAQI